MNERLKAIDLQQQFSGTEKIPRQSLKEFYQQFNPQLKETTFRWMLYELKTTGLIKAVDRGVFALSAGPALPAYIPTLSKNMKTLYKKIAGKTPFADSCLWETSCLNEFLLHQPGKTLTVVEVEIEAAEAVFHTLKESYRNVFLFPSRQDFEYYIYSSSGSIVIKKLVSQSPLLSLDGIRTPKLEKLLVDLVADSDFFYPYQGNERTTLFRNAFMQYQVSLKTLYRYAQRRKCRQELEYYLQQNQILPASTRERSLL